MFVFDRRYFRYFDWYSFSITLLLVLIGLLFVFSATYKPLSPFSLFFKKQLVGSLLGFVVYFLFCTCDIKILVRWSVGGYLLTLGLLLYSTIGGLIAMGGRRWISLYFFRFQPSELAKLYLPAFLATYFAELTLPRYAINKPIPYKDFILPVMFVFIGFFLILKQPDLGTALLVLFSGTIILWFVGIPKSFFIVIGCLGLLTAPLLWRFLKPYQQTRILVLFGHGDPKKERYQAEQSKIAIGSGGIFGKGLLKGTQNKFDFLPEDHTDFIFSVLCEELGFFGAIIILLLYGLLISRILFILAQINNFFEQIVGIGLLSHIMISVFVNIGMVTGMLPIVGIPLPLFSYGLTNLLITLASLGWLNNISIRRFYY